MVICLEQDADLHIAQLRLLPLTVSCFSKIQIGFPFWYWLTRVVPEKGPLNGCVCVCVCVCYKQERGCLMHFACLANRLLKYEESARDNHVVACNFAKYSPIDFTFFSLADSVINLS